MGTMDPRSILRGQGRELSGGNEGRQADRQASSQTDMQTDTWTHRQTNRHTHRQTHRQIHEQTDRQVDRHTDTETGRQMNKHCTSVSPLLSHEAVWYRSLEVCHANLRSLLTDSQTHIEKMYA